MSYDGPEAENGGYLHKSKAGGSNMGPCPDMLYPSHHRLYTTLPIKYVEIIINITLFYMPKWKRCTTMCWTKNGWERASDGGLRSKGGLSVGDSASVPKTMLPSVFHFPKGFHINWILGPGNEIMWQHSASKTSVFSLLRPPHSSISFLGWTLWIIAHQHIHMYKHLPMVLISRMYGQNMSTPSTTIVGIWMRGRAIWYTYLFFFFDAYKSVIRLDPNSSNRIL